MWNSLAQQYENHSSAFHSRHVGGHLHGERAAHRQFVPPPPPPHASRGPDDVSSGVCEQLGGYAEEEDADDREAEGPLRVEEPVVEEEDEAVGAREREAFAKGDT